MDEDDEVSSRADVLARLIGEIATEEGLQAEAKALMKSKINGMQLQVHDLADQVARREEKRTVEVVVEYTGEDTIRETRNDTGEIIITRQPFDAERQAAMSLRP